MSDEIKGMVEEIPALRRYSRTLCNNKSNADDLVQDTLERAIAKIHLYEPGTKLRFWLFTIMRNLFLDTCRKNKKMATISVELSGVAVDYRGADQIDKLAHQDLIRELSAMKPEYRELLMLVGVHGMSYEEAAQVTGVPLGTVRSRLFRARNTLLDRVEGEKVTRSRLSHATQKADKIEIDPALLGAGSEATGASV